MCYVTVIALVSELGDYVSLKKSTNPYLLLVPTKNGQLMAIVFANDPGDLGSIPGRVIPKTQNGTWCLLA